jgi:hypothetical protein
MAKIASSVTYQLVQILSGPSGIAPSIAEFALDAGLEERPFAAAQILPRNASFEVAERSTGVVYPAIHVYCEKVVNNLREKFRTFSGTARMTIEIRASQDRLENLEQRLEVYTDAVTAVLDCNRGDWGLGICFTGGYEITTAPVRHGGRNFLQVAKVSFDVLVSRD